MANDRLTGPQKAALFLFLLGEEVAAEVIKNLDEEEIKKLGASHVQESIGLPKNR